MVLMIEVQPVPLVMDEAGVARIGNTRVTLDTVIAAFSEGATPEEIAQQYPTLSLPDVYSVLGYYLRQRTEVDKYLRQRQKQTQGVRKQNELRFDPHGVRDRLLARRSSKGS